jgi:hypothetical protein
MSACQQDNISSQRSFVQTAIERRVELARILKDTSAGWPFYLVAYYPPCGRENWLEFTYHFGG